MLNPLHMKVLARPESAQEVRTVLRGWLAPHVDEREIDDAELIATELVANSVRHAGLEPYDVVQVRVAAHDEVLHLEVEDDGNGGRPQRRVPDGANGGLGLNLVHMLAIDWGVEHNGHTKVWAELPAHRAA
jgi:anti-sigma regulatory factor (Ser/Thr protein kinase)